MPFALAPARVLRALPLILLAPMAHGQVLLSTGFEQPSYTPGNIVGQQGWTAQVATLSPSDQPATISSAQARTGTQSLRIDASVVLSSQSFFWTPTPSPLPPPNRQLLISASILLGTDVSTRSDLWGLSAFDSSGRAFAAVGLDFLGRAKVTDAAGAFSLVSSVAYPGGQWHALTMALDFDARTYRVSIDGNTIAVARPFNAAATGTFSDADVLLSGPLFDVAYFDDLSIVAIPVPAPGTLPALALAGAIAARRRRATARCP